MKCQNIKEKLYLYNYGLLNFFQEVLLKQHLKKCPACQTELKLVQYKTELINIGKPEERVKESLDKKIISLANQIGHEEQQNTILPLKNPFPFTLKLGLAFASVLIIGFIVFQQINTTRNIGIIHITNNALLNDEIVKGKKVLNKKTELIIPKNSEAQVIYRDFFDIKLFENTKFFISEEKKNFAYIKMDDGTGYFNIKKNKGKIKIETINAIIKITGTKFNLFVDKKNRITIIDMKEGGINIWNKFYPADIISAKTKERVIIENNKIPFILKGQIKKIGEEIIFQRKKLEIFKEKVYLRDGNIIVGKIIKQDKEKIIIESKTGILKLNNNDIEKVKKIK